MKEISLTQGKVSPVDDEDYTYLSQWKWYYSADGYAVRSYRKLNGKRGRLYMHRIINNTPKGIDTDHINRDRLYNRKINLRNATRMQNLANTDKPKNNRSGYKGVSWNKKNCKWHASIRFNRKKIHLGYFHDVDTAAVTYDIAAYNLYGKFAKMNFLGA